MWQKHRNINWEEVIHKVRWETYRAYNKVGNKADSLHFVFVLQGERGLPGPPGIQGETGIGLPGPKVGLVIMEGEETKIYVHHLIPKPISLGHSTG